MFDISFTELMLAGVVALIVIGPEKLPKVARTVGHLLGRAQRYVSDVKGDIQREVELDELRKMKQEMESAAQSMKSSFTETESELRKGLQDPLDQMKSLGGELEDDLNGIGKDGGKHQSQDELKEETTDEKTQETKKEMSVAGQDAGKEAPKDEFDYDYQPILKPASDALNGLGNVPASGAKVQVATVEVTEATPPQSASATSAAPQEPKT